MDDMNAFERQVAGEVVRAMGPIRPVDDLAMLHAARTVAPTRWSVRPLFRVSRFVVAGVVVALVGGFLLAGVMTTQRADESRPAVGTSPSSSPDKDASATPEPSVRTDILPGVELRLAAVEPGVRRILSDGERDLEWSGLASAGEKEVVATAGDIWIILADSARQLGETVDYSVDARADLPHEVAVTGSSSIDLVPADDAYPPTWSPGSLRLHAVGPGQIAWSRPGGLRLLRYTPDGIDEFTTEDDIPVSTGQNPGVGRRMVVAPDGAAWLNVFERGAPGNCAGLARYDGHVSTYFLQDRGFCVTGLDVDDRGRVWVLGYTVPARSDAPDDYRDRLYVIDVSGTNLDGQGRENDMDRKVSPRATAVAAMSLATALAAAIAPAVEAQDPQPTMSEFTGRLGCGTAGPLSEAVSWQFPVVEISDERFAGTYVNQLAGYEDGDPDVDGIGAYSALWEITNEGGGWVGDTASFRFPPESYSTFTVKLDGQGAYEGLTAVLEADFTEDCGFDLRGVVVNGDLPATPTAVATTE